MSPTKQEEPLTCNRRLRSGRRCGKPATYQHESGAGLCTHHFLVASLKCQDACRPLREKQGVTTWVPGAGAF